VVGAATISGIDFSLDPPGSISGRIVDQVSGSPIVSAHVFAWNASGGSAGVGYTNSYGVYEISSLDPGNYYVSVGSSEGYLEELYDNIPCPGGPGSGCTPTKGTPIPGVANGNTVVNFSLQRFDSGIDGLVSDASTGNPLSGVEIHAWNVSEDIVGTTTSDLSGKYYLPLSPGTYRVSTENLFGIFDELWNGLTCSGACTPAGSTPITVSSSTDIVSGIDFALMPGAPPPYEVFKDGFESGTLSAWTSTVP